MSELFLEQINTEAVLAEWENAGSRRLKREWIKRGYSHQMSFYGILTDKETGESNYSRVEVLAEGPFDYGTTFLLYQFFRELKPLDSYSIWVYSPKEQGVQVVGRYHRHG